MSKQFPETIIKGDTLSVDIISSDYAASDGYALNVYLTGPSGTPVPYTFSTTDNNGIFELRVLPAVTNGFQAGLFSYAIVADDGTDQFTIEQGNSTVEERPDFLTVTDFRTHEQIVLDNIESVIEGRATQDQKSYTINGRTLERMALADLLSLRKYYKDLVTQQKGRSRNKLKTRMGLSNRPSDSTRYRSG